jgi:hypothetical protein
VNNSALSTSTAGTTANASIVLLRFRLLWCVKSIAAATSRFLRIEGRTRGESSLFRDGEDEERDRKGEKVERLRARVWVVDFVEGDVLVGIDCGGEGRRGNGILISV